MSINFFRVLGSFFIIFRSLIEQMGFHPRIEKQTIPIQAIHLTNAENRCISEFFCRG